MASVLSNKNLGLGFSLKRKRTRTYYMLYTLYPTFKNRFFMYISVKWLRRST